MADIPATYSRRVAGPIPFRDPQERPAESAAPAEPGARPPRRSWLPLLLGTGAALAVALGLVWVLVPKGSPPDSAVAEVLAEPLPSFTNRDADARAKASPRPYDGPPRFTVQLLDTDRHTCPATFTESIVIPVIEGDVRSITAVVRVPYDKIVRKRELYEFNGEWSTIIGGLPTKRTVKLLLIAQGTGGETTIAKDISHICPGKPVDKPDPRDLGSKLARKKIRENMFDWSFEFDKSDRRKADPAQSDEPSQPSSSEEGQPQQRPAGQPRSQEPRADQRSR